MKIAHNSKILAKSKKIGKNIKIGENVIIECNELTLGDNVAIGVWTEENFRNLAGVRIKVDKLILEDRTAIGREVFIKGGTIHLGENVNIKGKNTINVKDKLQIEGYGTINEHCEVSGRDIAIGQELWMLPYTKIGGGSCFEVHSKLHIGHYCHIGMYCFLNTARPIHIGNEVGMGTRTALYTHGAYSSALKGFPIAFGEIHIGDCVWIPGAIINPGVKIGKNCVIGVNSLVREDIPDGSFAAGSPAKIIKKKAFPQEISSCERNSFFCSFLRIFAEIYSHKYQVKYSEGSEIVKIKIDKATVLFRDCLDGRNFNPGQERTIFIVYINNFPIDNLDNFNRKTTIFDLKNKHIYGFADSISERLLNQLRRYGIRFYSRSNGKRYVIWR